MPTTDAQKKATLKYREKALSRITLDMKTEIKELIVKRAKEKGTSTQGYIMTLIKNDIGDVENENR